MKKKRVTSNYSQFSTKNIKPHTKIVTAWALELHRTRLNIYFSEYVTMKKLLKLSLYLFLYHLSDDREAVMKWLQAQTFIYLKSSLRKREHHPGH